MQTQNTRVLVTTSGQPFRPAHVIACGWQGDTGVRVTMDCGEVIRDHWKTNDEARAFMKLVRCEMQGIPCSTTSSQGSVIEELVAPEEE